MPQGMHLHGVCACTPLACSSTSTRGPRHLRRDQAEATLAGAMAAMAVALELVAAGRAAAATKVANAAATKVANAAATTAMAMVSNDIRGGEGAGRSYSALHRLTAHRNAVSH